MLKEVLGPGSGITKLAILMLCSKRSMEKPHAQVSKSKLECLLNEHKSCLTPKDQVGF